MQTASRTIGIDFDNTIASADPDNPSEIGPPEPGAIEALKEIHRRGFHIVLLTCRALKQWKDTDIPKVEAFLKEHGIDDIIVNITATKPVAMMYIDDRAINYNGNWDAIIKALPNSGHEFDTLRGTRRVAQEFCVGPARLAMAIYQDFDEIGSFTTDIPDEKDDNGWTEVTIKVKCK
jgi:hypothetical protein